MSVAHLFSWETRIDRVEIARLRTSVQLLELLADVTFLFQDSIRDAAWYVVVPSLWAPIWDSVSDLFSVTWTILRSTFREDSLYGNLSHSLLMPTLGLWVWGMKSSELKYSFHHIRPLSSWYVIVSVDLGHLAEVVSVRFLQWKATPNPRFLLYCLKRSCCVQPRVRQESYAPHPFIFSVNMLPSVAFLGVFTAGDLGNNITSERKN